MFKAAVVTFVSSEQTLNCDLSAFVFRNISPCDKVFAVISVKGRVDQLLRPFRRLDIDDPKRRLGVSSD